MCQWFESLKGNKMTQKVKISIGQAVQDLQNLTKQKITFGDVAGVLGVSRQAISNRAARNSELQEFEWEKLKEHFVSERNVNIEDLKADLLQKRMNYLDKKDEVELDYYPEVFGSCGTGTFVPAEYKEKMLVPKKLINSFSMSKQYSVINAFGDSMFPYIHDKDKLIVEHWNGEQIKDNRVYVFRYGEKLFCKRLVDNLNYFVVKSENPIYKPIEVEPQDIQIIGQIVGLLRNVD